MRQVMAAAAEKKVEASRGLIQDSGGGGGWYDTVTLLGISFVTDVTAAAEYARAQCGIASNSGNSFM